MLTSPYKGKLVDLLAPPAERADIFAHAAALHSIQLTKRHACCNSVYIQKDWHSGHIGAVVGGLGQAGHRVRVLR